ncbi:MAG: NAD(P)/FAD-dependent oxidoreductase [Saprospiraceae bacterium]|nr:NAD(P)/FAD-dependent oxidoreductase [Saprospiraceae bacterium]
MDSTEHIYEVIIIGSGFSGIGTAITLRKQGIYNFLILERDEELGGTWWRNSYPGAAVDVPSHLYSFSFEPYQWSRLYAKQKELLAYTKHLIKKYKIAPKAKCNHEVTQLSYDDQTSIWTVETRHGKSYRTHNIVNASGGLSQKSIPEIPNQAAFQGKAMHTAYWDHSFDYNNKRVAVIGTGASAVQVIPAIASKVKQLYVFQRTPHWVLPRPDRALRNYEQQWLERYPIIAKVYREWTYWKQEARMLGFNYFPKAMKIAEHSAQKHLKKQISNKTLRQKVTPNYTIGCKRILLSSSYYPSLTRSNVTLLDKTSGIESLTENGIKTIDGQEIQVDLIVYATGFKASENNISYPIIGKGGFSLQEYWGDEAHAYLGSTVPYFPNFYLVTGPNTGLGHNSIIHVIESQLQYIGQAIAARKQNGWQAIEVQAETEREYNKLIQKQLERTVWQNGGCESWYQTQQGVNTVLYPSFTFEFRRLTSKFKPKEHIIHR